MMEQKVFEVNEEGVLVAYHGVGGEVILPEGIKSIAHNVFYQAKNHCIQLPSTLERIEDYAFERSEIQEVSIPARLTYLGRGAFSDCTKLENVYFNGTSKLEELGACSFLGCRNLVRIVSDDKEFHLPHSLKRIGEETFSECKSLEKIIIPSGISVLEGGVFSDCYSLQSVTLPATLEEISGYDFSDCTALEEITLPPNLKKLGSHSFADCTSLKKIIIPDSILEFGGAIFRNTPFLKENKDEFVIMGDGILVAYNDKGTITDNIMQIPEGIKSIVGSVFHESPYYRMELPKTLERIEDSAFHNSFFREIRIPKSVQYIGDSAFAHCRNLASVTFECDGQCTEIGDRVFTHCVFLSCVTVEGQYDSVGSEEQHISFNKLPNILKNLGISAFQSCTSLDNLRLPENMTYLPESTFAHCSSLKSVNLPADLKAIHKKAFQDCSGLREISFPHQLKKIEDLAFSGCSSLSTVTIPDSVEEVHETAFKDCHPYFKIEGWTFSEIEEQEQ